MTEAGDRPRGIGWLAALNHLNATQGRPIYEGTASRHKVARRRAKNRVARISRRKNRP